MNTSAEARIQYDEVRMLADTTAGVVEDRDCRLLTDSDFGRDSRSEQT